MLDFHSIQQLCLIEIEMGIVGCNFIALESLNMLYYCFNITVKASNFIMFCVIQSLCFTT